MLAILYYRCMQIHLLKGTHMCPTYTHTHIFKKRDKQCNNNGKINKEAQGILTSL